MNFVSIIGLLTLLGCAWLLSYHKRKVNFQQIIWGIGLQFLFALIILKDDHFSFIGMGILGLLISNFLLKDLRVAALEAEWQRIIVNSLICLVPAGGLYLLGTTMSGGVLLIILFALVALLFLNGKFKIFPIFQPLAGAVMVITGVVYLVVEGLHGQIIFQNLSDGVASFLALSDFGAEFIFGNLAKSNYFGPWDPEFPNKGTWPGIGFQFGFKVLPTIIFFGGFMSILYYFGIIQKVIDGLSKFMRWTIRTSGAETMSCTANIFVGQTEAPLLIKPFINDMTDSELLTIMVGGFATIAGGVLAGYIAFGVPAGHLLAASVMSAPAALVVGKLIYPELKHSVTAGDVELPQVKVGENVIEAASNGIIDGLKLAVNVGAMLIGFIALIAVIDFFLNHMDALIDGQLLGGTYSKYEAMGISGPAQGEFSGYFPGSLMTLFGTLLKPLAFVMGVPWKDAHLVGNLLGIKLSLNEFVAYGTLGTYIEAGVIDERSKVIATYALCGFANFSSIGIQIGGISAIAPDKKTALAKLGLKAMLGGAIASWLTATIAGILM